MGQPVLGDLRAIGLDRSPIDERHDDYRRSTTLPAPNLRQQRHAGATAWVGEEHHDRFAQRTHGLQRHRLPGKGRKGKAGSRRTNGEAGYPCRRW